MNVTSPPHRPDLDDRTGVSPEALIEEARQRARRRRQRNLVGVLATALGAIWLYSVIAAGGANGPNTVTTQPPYPAGALKSALPEELSYTANSGVWLVHRDGTRHRLVDGLYERAPDGTPVRTIRSIFGVEWSPDGSELLAFRQSASPALVLVDEKGNVSEPIAAGASVGSWSPDGTRIAFVRPEREAGYVIYVVSRDGGRLRRVATRAQFAANASLSWAPDGRRLVYAGQHNAGLFIADAGGRGTPRPIRIGSDGDGPAPGTGIAHPQWSPDGSLIAFQSRGRIFVVHPDGTGSHRIADGRDIAWSPTGEYLAFLGVTPSDYGDVYVVRPGGTGLHRIAQCDCTLRGPGFSPSLSWSHDGTRIAYISTRGNTVSTVRPNGSGAARVATQSAQGPYPWWPLWRPARG